MNRFLVIAVLFSLHAALAQNLAPLKVIVMNKARIAQANEKITFTSKKTGKEFVGLSDPRGQFKIHLPEDDTYGITVAVFGTELDQSTFDVPKLPPGAAFNTVTLEIVYDPPLSLVLENLLFDTGKSRIRPESYAMLDELVDYLKRKEKIKIRLEGHTDNVGSEESNLRLSEQRAEAVKNYLIEKGISGDRLKAKGFGAVKPIAENSSPEGRAKNRRTEVHLIE
jgi:outer membrane protein OmpA-like peptidoglycan-associated protein